MTQLPGAQARYLDARITTAAQPDLQLMLLDGASRFGRQAQQLWDVDSQVEERDRLTSRTLDVIEELVRSVTGAGTEPSKRLEEEYVFAFRQLALAQLNHDGKALEAALRVIDFHRETWKLACERLKSEAGSFSSAPGPTVESALLSGQSFSLQA
jgi:flagellar protein FliS